MLKSGAKVVIFFVTASHSPPLSDTPRAELAIINLKIIKHRHSMVYSEIMLKFEAKNTNNTIH